MNNFTIREYKESDKDQIIEMYEELSKFFVSIDTFSFSKKSIDHKKVARYRFTKMMRKVKKYDGIVCVADNNGTLIGFAGMYIEKQPYEETLDTIPMKTGNLDVLFVREKYRGQGLGQTLINEAEGYFKEKNCTHSTLNVWSPNARAHETYKKAGYKDDIVNMIKTL